MKWALFVVVMSHPTPTGLVYDSIGSCYAAEEQMRAEMAANYNQALEWAKAHKDAQTQGFLDMQASRILTGICIPSA